MPPSAPSSPLMPEPGLGRYRAVLGAPGVRAPLVASTAGALPIGMYVLGVLLLAREATGSFAGAGQVAAAFGLANAFGALGQGRLMDRLGQPRVLRPVAVAHGAAVGAFVLSAQAGAPTAVLLACAAAGGACLPQLPAAMRSLWPSLVTGEAQRHTAYAVGAVAFELAVVSAPAIVAGLIAVASPALAVATAAGIATAAALAFSATDQSRGWHGAGPAAGWLGPLHAPGMRTIFVAIAPLGAAAGIVQVGVPAFTAQRASAELGGVLLAGLSGGSLLGGLLFGSRNWPGSAPVRLAVLLAGLAVGCLVLTAAGSAAVLAVLLLAVGALLAPVIIVASSLLDVAAPRGGLTEAFSVMVMAVVAGNAGGSALGGWLVDAASPRAAFVAAAVLAGCGALTALVRRRTLRRRP